jgi:hypothetical protein
VGLPGARGSNHAQRDQRATRVSPEH